LIDRTRLMDQLRGLGLPRDGIVLVHCGLRRVGPVDGGAETLLSALAGVLGPGGTIVVPAQPRPPRHGEVQGLGWAVAADTHS
jgi:aminoglycoside 3-N-acetyltransferase